MPYSGQRMRPARLNTPAGRRGCGSRTVYCAARDQYQERITSFPEDESVPIGNGPAREPRPNILSKVL